MMFWMYNPTELPLSGVSNSYAVGWYSGNLHRVEMTPICLGYPNLSKKWAEVGLTHDFNGAAYIKAWVRPNPMPNTPWVYAGTFSQAQGRATLSLSGLQSEWLQVKLEVCHTTTWWDDINERGIQSVEVRAKYTPTSRFQHQFTAILTDDLELLDMTVENSAAFVTAALYSLVQGGVHVVGLPYPPPAGHTVSALVEMGGVGAAVPVLSYHTSCPGADVALTITEV